MPRLPNLSAGLGRIQFPERIILIALLLIGGCTWAFVEIADEVVEGESRHFDAAILQALRDPLQPATPRGPTWLLQAARDITALGGITVITLVTLASLGFLWLQRKRRAVWMVAFSVLGGALLMHGMKTAFGRERPSLVPHLVEVSSLSFPSGHSTLSAVIYLTLGVLLARTTPDRATRIYVVAVAMLLVVLIGLSRIYLGVHYPTDVLAGWLVGSAWALLCAAVTRWFQLRGKSQKTTPQRVI